MIKIIYKKIYIHCKLRHLIGISGSIPINITSSISLEVKVLSINFLVCLQFGNSQVASLFNHCFIQLTFNLYFYLTVCLSLYIYLFKYKVINVSLQFLQINKSSTFQYFFPYLLIRAVKRLMQRKKRIPGNIGKGDSKKGKYSAQPFFEG